MPNKYRRISVNVRGNWTEEQLRRAINAVQNDNISVRMAATTFGIPRKTLERRIKTKNDRKGKMGPSCVLGEENEHRLVKHIKRMQKHGFPLTIDDVRRMAYQFAVQLGIKHRFNVETEKAGYDWLSLFLARNSDISLRKSEGVSLARSQGMNRTEVDEYFKLMEHIMEEHELLDKPGSIFNMDETGLQLNNRPSHVLAAKGSKAVSTVTSVEKGETITVVACCNAEGAFIPPACIMKGKNKKQEYQDGMPPGSILFMSQKSAYINTEIFFEWLKNHFLPRKPAGKTLLLLDGHSTHCNSVEMLEFAIAHDILLVAMPSHTSHYLQPLDRAVFKSLKTYFYESCRMWLKHNPGRRITRLQFGELLSEAWGKSATPQNAISAFRATGVFPLNSSAIPDYAFSLSSGPVNNENNQLPTSTIVQNTRAVIPESIPSTSHLPEMSGTSQDLPETSFVNSLETSTSSPQKKETPSKILVELSSAQIKIQQVRKRAKQVSTLLTSPEHLQKRQMKEREKLRKEEKQEQKTLFKMNQKEKSRKRKAEEESASPSSSENEFILDDSESDFECLADLRDSANECKGCGENYYQTDKVEDWIKCVLCFSWLHENCTEFSDMCHPCGALQNNKKVKGKGKGIDKGKKNRKY